MQRPRPTKLLFLSGLLAATLFGNRFSLAEKPGRDFEGKSHAPRTVAGAAFGIKPARPADASKRPSGFEGHGVADSYAGADGKFVWADACINEKDSALVSSSAVPEPVAVRYGWSLNPTGANLYGKNRLPAN